MLYIIDSDPEQEYEVIRVTFADGTDVEIISEHGFFDIDRGEYVYLDADAAQYIGDSFVKQNGDEWTTTELVGVEIETRVTTPYSPVTAGHLCYYTNGMLSMPGGISGLFNIFEVDTDAMCYDKQKMEADIETYGLLTATDFEGIVTEEAFEAFNGRYLGIAIQKGLLTWDQIEALAERYMPKIAQ